MRSTIRLEVDITHARDLPTDAQGIADRVGQALTSHYGADPQLLATAKVYSSWIEHGGEHAGFDDCHMWPEETHSPEDHDGPWPEHDCAKDMPNEVECGVCGWAVWKEVQS